MNILGSTPDTHATNIDVLHATLSLADVCSVEIGRVNYTVHKLMALKTTSTSPISAFLQWSLSDHLNVKFRATGGRSDELTDRRTYHRYNIPHL